MSSRVLAAFLCLTLLLGTVPAAYAQESGEGPEAVEAGEPAAETEDLEAGEAKEPGEAPEEAPAESAETGQPEEAPEAGEGSGGTGLSEELPEEARAEMEEEPAPERPEPQAASGTVAYPVEGGNIYFDPETGMITDCDQSVTRADIPSSIGGTAVTRISYKAFYEHRNLKSVTIPDSVTSIGEQAFCGCSTLTSVTLPGSITIIGSCAFMNSGLTNVVIPDSVTEVRTDAFSYCGSLTSAVVGRGVSSIPENMFRGCTALTNVELPEGVTEIGQSAFEDCTALTSVVIPDSVTCIDISAYCGCSALTDLTISDNVLCIRNSAFANCSSLASVTLPASLTSLGYDGADTVFTGCTSLEEILVQDGNRAFTSIDGVLFDASKYDASIHEVICYPAGRKEPVYMVPDGVRFLSPLSFTDCVELRSVILPDSVTGIGVGAFYNCGSLESITLPDHMNVIWSEAFSGCGGLTSIVIPDGIDTIHDLTFRNCSSLASVTLPDSVGSIEGFAFENCAALNSIELPDAVTGIGADAFSGCTGLTGMILPAGLTDIGVRAFKGCKNMRSVSMTEGVNKIGFDAFQNCTGLRDVFYSGDEEQWGRISIQSGNDSLKNAAIHYHVNPNGRVKITAGESAALTMGASGAAAGTFTVECGGASGTLSWTSSDPSVFRLTGETSASYEGGTVTVQVCGDAAGPGTATVTAAASDGAFASFQVRVRCLAGMLTGWDEATGEIRLDGKEFSMGRYFITDQTSLPAAPESLLGKCLLLAPEDTGEDVIFQAALRSVQIVPSHVGRLTGHKGDTVVIDGVSRPSAVEGDVLPTTTHDEDVLYGLYNNTVVYLTEIQEKQGVLETWDGKRAVIAGGTYLPADAAGDLPELLAAPELAGWPLNYTSACGCLLLSAVPEETKAVETGTKRFRGGDGSSVSFMDGTSWPVGEGVTLELGGLEAGRYVRYELRTRFGETDAWLAALSPVRPQWDLSVTLNRGTVVECRGSLLRFQGETAFDPLMKTGSFQIPFTVKIQNTTRAEGVSQEDLRQDPALSVTVEGVTVDGSGCAGFGAPLGGGTLLKEGLSLRPGESKTVSGAILSSPLFSGGDPGAQEASYFFQVSAGSSLGEERVTKTFQTVGLKPEEPEIEELRRLAETAAGALDNAYRAGEISLDINVVRFILSMSEKQETLLIKDILTRIIMSNTPRETFQDNADLKTLQKVFQFKDFAADAASYSLPLTYMVHTKEYGPVKLEITCEISEFSLNGSRYSCAAKLKYRIVPIPDGKQYPAIPAYPGASGDLGLMTFADVKAFADAAYSLAEAELQSEFSGIAGAGVDEVGNLIFDETVTRILRENDTSYQNLAWKAMAWPSRTVKNACPTDVYVYNQAGELLGAVENGEITRTSEEFELSVEGEVKYIRGLPEGYEVVYAAAGEGFMDVEITEYAGAGDPVRVTGWYQIPLDVQERYAQTAPALLEAHALTAPSGGTLAPDYGELLAGEAWACTIDRISAEGGAVSVEFTDHDGSSDGVLIAAAFGNGQALDISEAALNGNGRAELALDMSGAQYVTVLIAGRETLVPLCRCVRQAL